MIIGIDASRAFLKNRTGIEEYSYQTIKCLRNELGDDDSHPQARQVVLYLRKNQQIDFELPENWKIKIINLPRFWTQIGLSLELLFNPVDCLFVPAHTVPLFHPKKTVVVVHGLEYEFCPKAYSWSARFYMRLTIRKSCQWASRIISVSENTKKDLIDLYGVRGEKIEVIYEGYNRQGRNFQFPISNFQSNSNDQISNLQKNTKYLLFIGRIEQRKNIENIVKAFEILKERYGVSHKLVLGGKPGFGYGEIKKNIADTNCADEIIELGYISEEEKWKLLEKSDVFVFPTFYEGFGIPVLEAQSVGTAVVASNNSSIPEVVGDSASLVDPNNAEELADAIYLLISNESAKNAIISKGLENVKRFSWEKCAQEIAKVLREEN